MCGIIFGCSLDGHPVNEEVYYQFQDQSNRGTRGFGAAMLDKPKSKEARPGIVLRRSTDEVGAICDLKLFESPLILFHHRMPTSSDNKIQQTHPIRVSNPLLEFDWLIAHNGICNNADLVKKTHYDMGFKYSTDNGEPLRNYNDSEAIATEIALYLERAQLERNYGHKKDKIDAHGSAAIVGLQLEKTSQIPIAAFYGRNSGNPLKVFRDQRVIFVSSEGKGEAIGVDEYTFIDLQHPKMKQKTYKMEIPYNYSYSSSNVGGTRGPVTVVNNKEDDTEDTRHWKDPDFTEGTGAQTYEFSADTNIQEKAEEMYDELETLIQQFIETICNADSVDYSDTYIKDMETQMKTMMEAMRSYHAKNILQKEEDEADKAVVEAARDEKLVVTKGKSAATPHAPTEAITLTPEKTEEALNNGA